MDDYFATILKLGPGSWPIPTDWNKEVTEWLEELLEASTSGTYH
jgi:hypothetical protein